MVLLGQGSLLVGGQGGMLTDTGLRTALDLQKLLDKNHTAAKVLIYQVLQTSLLELEQR
jgi:hypothetical protein